MCLWPRGMAQLGSALRSGRRGRGFKSRYPDHLEQVGDLHFSEVWIASLFFYAHPVTRLSPIHPFICCQVDSHPRISGVNRRSFKICMSRPISDGIYRHFPSEPVTSRTMPQIVHNEPAVTTPRFRAPLSSASSFDVFEKFEVCPKIEPLHGSDLSTRCQHPRKNRERR